MLKGAVIEYDEAAYAVEDEPLLTARANAVDLGGTVPVPPSAGGALRFLATAVAARAVVEIGTGCGSSGIWLLRGMRPGGVLTSVDTEPEYLRLARKSFAEAGFAANQARLILGRALDVLPRLSDGAYDLVFCDADQAAYPEYLSAGLRLLRPGGIIVFNDVLPPGSGPATDGVRELAGLVGGDERLVPLLLPIAGGMLAAIKRLKRAHQNGACSTSTTRATRLNISQPDCPSSHGLQCVTERCGLVGRQLNDEPAATLQWDAHHDATALLGHLERAIARPRLHRRHAASPSANAHLMRTCPARRRPRLHRTAATV